MVYVGERAWKPWDILKRSTRKNWYFFWQGFLPLYSQNWFLSPKSRLPVVKTKLPLWMEKSFAKLITCMQGSSHSTWTSTALLFPWLGLVQTVTHRALLYRHRTGSQPLLPGCLLPLKLTVNIENWLSPALPLCECGKTEACKKYSRDCFWMRNVNSLSDQFLLKPTLRVLGLIKSQFLV